MEGHNEDIVLPVANPTLQPYIDKLIIRAGQQDKDNSKTYLLDAQTRQASGDGNNEDFMSAMALGGAEMKKDLFTQLKLG